MQKESTTAALLRLVKRKLCDQDAVSMVTVFSANNHNNIPSETFDDTSLTLFPLMPPMSAALPLPALLFKICQY